MTHPKFPSTITAVLATYNRTKYLAEAVASLLNQDLPLHEVIVVDDGSVEDTFSVLQPFQDRIKFFKKENGGRATALNLGVAHATGEWLWFFDDDDVAMPDASRRMLHALSKQPSADFVYSGSYNGYDGVGGNIEIRDSHVPYAYGPEEILLRVMIRYDFRTQGMLVRKRCFEQIGGFDKAFLRSQDYELMSRLLHEFDGVCLPEPTFIWRHHPGVRGPKGLEHTESEREQIWLKFDGMLGRKIRANFTLGDFLIPREKTDNLPPASKRAALINRMAVMASKGLIEETLADATAAAAIESDASMNAGFTASEWRMCIETVLHPYFLDVLISTPNRFMEPFLRERRTPSLRRMAACFARGIFYSMRWDNLQSLKRAKRKQALRLLRFAGIKASLNVYREKG